MRGEMTVGNQKDVISEVRFRMLDEEKDGLLGFASCVLNGAYYLNNIAIRRGQDGQVFLSFPSTRSQQAVQHFHWNPISKEASRALERAILGRLRQMQGETGRGSPASKEAEQNGTLPCDARAGRRLKAEEGGSNA